MFLVVGKGVFTKDRLKSQLQQWGFVNPDDEITHIEKVGRVELGNVRVMVIR